MIHNKRVPCINGMSIDKAHKGGGKSLPSPSEAFDAFKDDPLEWNRLQLDPGGLFGASDNELFANVQGMIDVGGIGAQKGLNARAEQKAVDAMIAQQAKEQAKQQAILDKQTDLVSAETTKRAKLAMGGGYTSLLTGTQLGIADKKRTLG